MQLSSHRRVAVRMAEIVHLLIYLVVVFGVLGILWWAFQQFNLPQPFRIVLVVVAVVVSLLLLLQVIDGTALGFH